MNLVACDGTWTQSEGSLRCTGTLVEVPHDPGITLEDAKELSDQTLVLFAIVFGYLALRKALN